MNNIKYKMSQNSVIIDTSDIPSWERFQSWGVVKAYPTFGITIYVDIDDDDRSMISVVCNGYYYCSGSCNFELEKVLIDDSDDVASIRPHTTVILEALKKALPEGEFLVTYKDVTDVVREYLI